MSEEKKKVHLPDIDALLQQPGVNVPDTGIAPKEGIVDGDVIDLTGAKEDPRWHASTPMEKEQATKAQTEAERQHDHQNSRSVLK